MNDRLYRVFGSRVRQLREEKNVTQDQLAQLVELSRTSITNIESGRQRVLLHQIVDIARALGAEPQNLLPEPGAEPEAAPLRKDVARVVALLESESSASS